MRLTEALQVIEGVTARAVALDIHVCIAVYSADARLVAFHRMDDAVLGGSFGAHAKATAAVAFGRSTGELAALAETPLVRGIERFEGMPLLMVAGGVPLHRDGVLIGSCGVGGASPQQDEDCANAGAATIHRNASH